MPDNTTDFVPHTDEGLQKNHEIETAITRLQAQPSQQMLAHVLTVIRRQMQANAQLVVAVEPPAADQQLRLQAIKTDDGKQWWAAFTSFEEELKGGGSIMSTFLADSKQLFTSALSVEEIEGVILNPWNCTLMLDKTLLRIILGLM